MTRKGLGVVLGLIAGAVLIWAGFLENTITGLVMVGVVVGSCGIALVATEDW